MIVKIPDILTKAQITEFRTALESLPWVDGRVSAGHQSVTVKDNLQLDMNNPGVQELSFKILDILQQNPTFISSALPLKISPPMFNKYQNGGHYGTHVDSAIRQIANTAHRLRTDMSATLFLSDPDEYQGGELTVEDANGSYQIKLPAGSMVLYESGRLHDVAPVTSGVRVASFFWVQSMVKNAEQRAILLELDVAIQNIAHNAGKHISHRELVHLTSVYHNLLRMWGDC